MRLEIGTTLMHTRRFIALLFLLTSVLSAYAPSVAASAPDIEKLRVAGEGGDAKAAFELGKLYQKGYGVSKDDAQAFSWYLKAADKGEAKAQLALGKQCYTGQGTEKNYVQSYFWLNLAAIHGNKEAYAFLGKVKKFMSAPQVAEAKGLTNKWLSQHGEAAPANKSKSKADAAKKYCITTMADFAKKNGVDPTQYITQNMSYLQQCIQAESIK